jgi:hypothetical protein
VAEVIAAEAPSAGEHVARLKRMNARVFPFPFDVIWSPVLVP